MRMFKILAATVAAAAVTLGMSVGPVQAEEVTSERAGFGRYNVFAKDDNTLVAQGEANRFRRKIVLIQRARANGHDWTTIARVRTSRTGKFRTTLQAGRDIPCNGTRFKTRAKKKGQASFKLDLTDDGQIQVWFCTRS